MKRAIVFFNLGGPDSPDAVQPFLFNLFNDPAIIGVPNPMRWLLAKLISSRRAPIAREIYSHLGGKSPLLEETTAQANALEALLVEEGVENKVFICMRYWHPMSAETVRAVKEFGADEVVLLPLYPQYSTTTTGSSFKDWRRMAAKAGLNAPVRAVCCYPTSDHFIASHVETLSAWLDKIESGKTPRVLFSAHGLPKKVIAKGDPYQWQVEQTAAAVAHKLDQPDLDWLVCYQSRVGPLEWIGPSTEDEIERAGADDVALVIVPIAFVSEHSETLVELDIEYGELAEEAGVKEYKRVPTLSINQTFIEDLAAQVRFAITVNQEGCQHASGDRVCPSNHSKCPHGAWPT